MKSSPDDMDRVVEEGDAFFSGQGGKHQSRNKRKDGDESEAMAAVLGTAEGSWGQLLDDGCDNPYPYTVTALKNKNTRGNNDPVR